MSSLATWAKEAEKDKEYYNEMGMEALKLYRDFLEKNPDVKFSRNGIFEKKVRKFAMEYIAKKTGFICKPKVTGNKAAVTLLWESIMSASVREAREMFKQAKEKVDELRD